MPRVQVTQTLLTFKLTATSLHGLPAIIFEKLKGFGVDPDDFQVSISAEEQGTHSRSYSGDDIAVSSTWDVSVSAWCGPQEG